MENFAKKLIIPYLFLNILSCSQFTTIASNLSSESLSTTQTIELDLEEDTQRATTDILFVIDRSDHFNDDKIDLNTLLKNSLLEIENKNGFSVTTKFSFLYNIVADPNNSLNLPPYYSNDVNHPYYQYSEAIRHLPGFMNLVSNELLQKNKGLLSGVSSIEEYCDEPWLSFKKTIEVAGVETRCVDLILNKETFPYQYNSSSISLKQFLEVNSDTPVFRGGNLNIFMVKTKASISSDNQDIENKKAFESIASLTPTKRQLYNQIKKNSNPKKISIHEINPKKYQDTKELSEFISKSINKKSADQHFSYLFSNSIKKITAIKVHDQKVLDFYYHPKKRTLTFSVPKNIISNLSADAKKLTIEFE